jgi:hypothetical protein
LKRGYSKMKRFIVGAPVTVALAIPAAAAADSCTNVSRAPAACGMTCTAPVVGGNWVWLPSIGAPIAAWGFAPPGAPDSTALGFPGANGNYSDGQTSSLLGMSAICQGGGNVNTVRQGSNGRLRVERLPKEREGAVRAPSLY